MSLARKRTAASPAGVGSQASGIKFRSPTASYLAINPQHRRPFFPAPHLPPFSTIPIPALALEGSKNGESWSGCAQTSLPPGILAQDPHRPGQFGRLIIALLATDNVYATSTYDERTVLVIIQWTRYVLEELDTMNTIVHDSKDDDALFQGMYMVDNGLLLPVRLLPSC